MILNQNKMRLNLTGKVLNFLVLGTLVVSSCQGEMLPDAVTEGMPVNVGLYAGGVQARTSILENGLTAVWESGDELAVWARNSAGEFTLQNQIFKTYGLDNERGFFTSTLASAMPEDTYTYFCCYPNPKSVNGTKVTFNIPSIQDGLVSGGADVMIATPESHGAMTSLPEVEDHSNLQMKMKRMMHQFRFFVPEEDALLGDGKIERILMSFPSGVVGDVTLDYSDVTAAPVLSDPQSDIELNLVKPIGVSKGGEYEFACLSMAPVKFEEGQSLNIVKAYTKDKIAYFDSIDLKAKECLAGHSTPVKLKIMKLVDYAGIIYFTLSGNNLGENPRKITLEAPSGCKWGDNGTTQFVYDPGREILLQEVIAVKFEQDLDAYKSLGNKQIKVTYESENAIVTEDITMPAISNSGTTNMSLTVPYLLFEDFSCVYKEAESNGNNDYSSSDTSQPGSSLDGCMSHTGWSAARYWTTGNCIRINSRHQEVSVSIPFVGKISFASNHHGRLDSCPLSGIKKDKTVSLAVTFDAGGNKHSSSSLDILTSAICVSRHEKSGVQDGIPTGKSSYNKDYSTTLADFGDTFDTIQIGNDYGANAFDQTFDTYSVEVTGAKSISRICFYPTLTTDSGIGNAEFNVYIDNIKVKIVK